MNLSLVPDWKDCWRWFSMHSLIVAQSLIGSWIALPDDMREVVPVSVLLHMVLIILLLGTIGRLLEQKKAKSESSP